MHAHFFASTLAGLLLASSTLPDQVLGHPVAPVLRRDNAPPKPPANYSAASVIASVPSGFTQNGTNPSNPNATVSCYKNQYIDSLNFTLAVQQGCAQIGTTALKPGQRYWQTMKTFEAIPGSTASNKTLFFAAEDPNAGKPAKVDMYVSNNATQGSVGSMTISPDMCMSLAEVVIQQCKSQAGNQPGGTITVGSLTLYVDSGVP